MVITLAESLSGQPLSDRELEILETGYKLYDLFYNENLPYKTEVRTSRKIALIKDPMQDSANTPVNEKAAQLHTLRSTLVNCIADQMDNIPEAIIRSERPDTMNLAEDLTDMVSRILEINNWTELHRYRTEDNFVAGTSVTQVVWDDDMAYGDGEVAILNVPIESIEWDPQCEDFQDGRALFKATWHPRQFYKEHYPDANQYVMQDSYHEVGKDRSDTVDESIMLLEYWYRVYDAKARRYRVHVAYLAGNALLYYSEKEYPDGVYEHGMYPFTFDIYTRVLGSAVGNGMVTEFAPMQRAINRYAKYIDENARASAKMRLLVNSGANLSEDDLADWSKQIITGDAINDNAVRWFQSAPLSSQVNLQMNQFMDMLKQDSGQNQFNRGEGGLGVTAATAIQSLQEAGGKTSRYRTEIFKSGTKRIVSQVLWLIKQFYTDGRKMYVTGRKDDEMREVDASPRRLFSNEKDVMPYAVRIQIQRNNPLRVQAENESIMSAANVLAQGSNPLDPTTLISMLHLDGKDKIMNALQNNNAAQMLQLQQALMAAQQQNEQLAAQYQQDIGSMQTMLQQQAAALAETQAEGQDLL